MNLYEKFRLGQSKLLEERALRVEKAIEQQDGRVRLDVLVLHISGERYAIPIEKILSVQEKIAVKPLAGTPPHIAGMANVRGHVVSVLNLAAILGISRPDQKILNLVLLDEEGAQIAFAVEDIQDVQEIFLEELITLPHESPYLKGILSDGTVLLNLDAIMNDPELVINQE
jgi:purine-binding chemotaxis protein CheW